MKKTIVFAFILLACISVLFAQDANKDGSGLSADTITAICSIIIAGLALIITLWQGYVTRKHNRLSVTPRLCFSQTIVPEEKSKKVTNKGIGPAIIKKVRIYLDGKQIEYRDLRALWVLNHNLKLSKDQRPLVRGFGKEEMISAGEEIIIFSIKTSDSIEKALKEFNRIDMAIDYKSIYGDFFTESTMEGPIQR